MRNIFVDAPEIVDLNQGQEAAAEAFFQFLFSSEKEFIVSGPGGVGKTHLMSHLIDRIMPRYFETCEMMGIPPEYQDVVMTATTNKAAEVLGVATKRPTQTIHSFLNLKVSDDYATGKSNLVKTENWTVHQKLIVFIDESSMMDKPLIDVLHEGTLNCKIIYVGDHCQLAPIMEPISPIYRKPIPFYELTQPMRTSNPDLLALNQQLRQTVETGEFKPIRIVPGSIDLLDDDQMQEKLAEIFTAQTHESRVLAYTNHKVMQYNDYIRDLRNLPDEYTTGEFLVNNNAIRLKKRMLSVEEEITIDHQQSNTTDVIVDKDVSLTVRMSDLKSSLGELFEGIPLPVDRQHFAELIKYYRGRKNWNRYFFLKNSFPDLRQRDAATVHKSQGSSYDSVIIDLGNISTCNVSHQVARMLYVAFSRARNRVYLYGKLADKYGGLITQGN